MPDLSPRMPCPVCLGVMMTSMHLGEGADRIEIDQCQRCGGVWFDHGEVMSVRARGREAFAGPAGGDVVHQPTQCHGCHVPLDRDTERCPACGTANVIDCPHCEQPMKVVMRRGVRLDACSRCHGTWFDRREVESIWTPAFDRALARRSLSRGDGVMVAADVAGDLAFHALFWTPDLIDAAATGAGAVVSAAGEAAINMPEVIGALPEVAGGVVEAAGEAAGSLFETIADIVGGLF